MTDDQKHLPSAPFSGLYCGSCGSGIVDGQCDCTKMQRPMTRESLMADGVKPRDPSHQTQMTGDPKPFMYGIMCPDGTAYLDEICVDGNDSQTLADVIEEQELGGHKVVPLYLHPPAPSRNIDDMRKAAWELVKKNGWDATARLSLHQTTELMAALAASEGQP